MTHSDPPNRDRLRIGVLTALLAVLLLIAGVGVGALSLWLLGPGLTVLVTAATVIGYLVLRAAVRSRS